MPKKVTPITKARARTQRAAPKAKRATPTKRIIPRTAKRAGGRPKAYLEDRVQLNTRTTPKTRDRLRAQAERRGVSVNVLVDRAIEEGLTRFEKERVKAAS